MTGGTVVDVVVVVMQNVRQIAIAVLIVLVVAVLHHVTMLQPHHQAGLPRLKKCWPVSCREARIHITIRLERLIPTILGRHYWILSR